MSRTRNSETTVDKQGEDVEKFATKVFRWVRQVNHHAKRGGTLLPVDVQVAVELSQYFTERDQGGRAFPSRKTLGDPLNISERTVDRSIRRMQEDDHLRVVWGKQGSKHSHQYWMVAKSEEGKKSGDSDGRLNRHPDACLNRQSSARLHSSETGISSKKTGAFERKTGTQAPENHYNHGNHGGDISGPPSESRGRADGESGEALLSVGMNSDGAKPDAGKADELAAEFARFWSQCPRKGNKAKARKAFDELTPSERAEVLAETPRYAAHRQRVIADDPTQRRYTLQAESYLKDHRWREEAQEYSSDIAASGPPTLDGKTGEPVPAKNVFPFKAPRNREMTPDEVYETAHRRGMIKEY